MPTTVTLAPKGGFVVKDFLGEKSVTEQIGSTTFALKHSNKRVQLAVELTDKSLNKPTEFKDAVLSGSYKVSPQLTLGSSYNLETKTYKATTTVQRTILNKPTALKLTVAPQKKEISGDVNVAFTFTRSARLEFGTKKLKSVKAALNDGDLTYEPSFSFEKRAPALAITKHAGPDKYKLSYDHGSRVYAAEWNRKPIKLVLSTKDGMRGLSFGATWEDNVTR